MVRWREERGRTTPRKIRQLKADLRRAGFREYPKRGDGSHSWWEYSGVAKAVVNRSGQDGDDATPDREQPVRQALANVRQPRE